MGLCVYEFALGKASSSGIAWRRHWERWTFRTYTLEALLSRVIMAFLEHFYHCLHSVGVVHLPMRATVGSRAAEGFNNPTFGQFVRRLGGLSL